MYRFPVHLLPLNPTGCAIVQGTGVASPSQHDVLHHAWERELRNTTMDQVLMAWETDDSCVQILTVIEEPTAALGTA